MYFANNVYIFIFHLITILHSDLICQRITASLHRLQVIIAL